MIISYAVLFNIFFFFFTFATVEDEKISDNKIKNEIINFPDVKLSLKRNKKRKKGIYNV